MTDMMQLMALHPWPLQRQLTQVSCVADPWAPAASTPDLVLWSQHSICDSPPSQHARPDNRCFVTRICSRGHDCGAARSMQAHAAQRGASATSQRTSVGSVARPAGWLARAGDVMIQRTTSCMLVCCQTEYKEPRYASASALLMHGTVLWRCTVLLHLCSPPVARRPTLLQTIARYMITSVNRLPSQVTSSQLINSVRVVSYRSAWFRCLPVARDITKRREFVLESTRACITKRTTEEPWVANGMNRHGKQAIMGTKQCTLGRPPLARAEWRHCRQTSRGMSMIAGQSPEVTPK
jgi:hypothetical protein